jgi:hypothetical protein
VVFFGMALGEVEDGQKRTLSCTASHNVTSHPDNADALKHLANGLRGHADQISPKVDLSRPIRRRK